MHVKLSRELVLCAFQDVLMAVAWRKSAYIQVSERTFVLKLLIWDYSVDKPLNELP